MLISLNFRHLIPSRSICAMRLAGRLVTSILISLSPARSAFWQSSTKGTAHAHPTNTLLIYTRALSRTSPRSMRHLAAACFLVRRKGSTACSFFFLQRTYFKSSKRLILPTNSHGAILSSSPAGFSVISRRPSSRSFSSLAAILFLCSM